MSCQKLEILKERLEQRCLRSVYRLGRHVSLGLKRQRTDALYVCGSLASTALACQRIVSIRQAHILHSM
jgi:hypothetical protein